MANNNNIPPHYPAMPDPNDPGGSFRRLDPLKSESVPIQFSPIPASSGRFLPDGFRRQGNGRKTNLTGRNRPRYNNMGNSPPRLTAVAPPPPQAPPAPAPTQPPPIRPHQTITKGKQAIDLFRQKSIEPNEYTYTILFKICSGLSDQKSMDFGKDLLKTLPNQYRNHTIILNSALHMLMQHGEVDLAEKCFSQMAKDATSYGVMMLREKQANSRCHGFVRENQEPERCYKTILSEVLLNEYFRKLCDV
ncbi:unnamed protein product [Adineta ricciae]|uniref:Uncharacterized protein n=1 Tax=Adineta ricciae TaxID=249248 RepID=A0A815SV26_ADIRI|nr:unnamed protein product [Adineta ricciae]